MQQVLDNLNDLPNSTGAKDLDLLFLRGIMESPIVRSLAKAHEKLEDTKLEAVHDNNLELVKEIINDITPIAKENDTAAELSHILQEPHFQSLLEAHDSVASKNYETPPPSPESYMDSTFNNQPVPPDAVRMVGIRKVKGEHLGVTFRVENSELVIARILHGGMIDQQGLLHVGDIIKEVNGKEVGNDPKVLQEMLQNASGSVILKNLPSYQEPHPPRQVFVKRHFEYDPVNDNLTSTTSPLSTLLVTSLKNSKRFVSKISLHRNHAAFNLFNISLQKPAEAITSSILLYNEQKNLIGINQLKDSVSETYPRQKIILSKKEGKVKLIKKKTSARGRPA
ncbi:MAGUK p55 subfamily member 2-like [Hypanus sabinus]|uniref:MAGUK p55 subfamily member 2-like n=1 Tax=Hypanus sabinus TaxID=79690 RepID=UPI0028C4BBDB|nr:MAGUK p55 subfamily member 2-like [Hypanus sabinus]